MSAPTPSTFFSARSISVDGASAGVTSRPRGQAQLVEAGRVGDAAGGDERDAVALLQRQQRGAAGAAGPGTSRETPSPAGMFRGARRRRTAARTSRRGSAAPRPRRARRPPGPRPPAACLPPAATARPRPPPRRAVPGPACWRSRWPLNHLASPVGATLVSPLPVATEGDASVAPTGQRVMLYSSIPTVTSTASWRWVRTSFRSFCAVASVLRGLLAGFAQGLELGGDFLGRRAPCSPGSCGDRAKPAARALTVSLLAVAVAAAPPAAAEPAARVATCFRSPSRAWAGGLSTPPRWRPICSRISWTCDRGRRRRRHRGARRHAARALTVARSVVFLRRQSPASRSSHEHENGKKHSVEACGSPVELRV